ncbi:MAG: hypothetical protein J7K15_10530 [Deltaproteobacteria bacterium]|nr:hypothetical protein [Deltaproteobacteria bacterium]
MQNYPLPLAGSFSYRSSGRFFFAYQMQGLVFDNSNEIWFVKGDRTLEIMDKFKATFGNDEFVFILFDTEDFFQPDTIRRIGRLADDLEAHVPYVKDMTWLGNVEHIEGIKGGVEIHELIKNVPDTAEEMAKIKEKGPDKAYIVGEPILHHD